MLTVCLQLNLDISFQSCTFSAHTHTPCVYSHGPGRELDLEMLLLVPARTRNMHMHATSLADIFLNELTSQEETFRAERNLFEGRGSDLC